MTDKIHIRKYNVDIDQSAVLELISKKRDWIYSKEDSSKEIYKLALENSFTYVAQLGNNLCGFLRGIQDNGLVIYVCELFVNPDCCSVRVANQLLEYIHEDYPEQPIYIMSGVDEYYRDFGFQKVGSVFKMGSGEY